MFIRNGEPFNIKELQIIGDVQYPAGWFEDSELRSAFDVIEIDDQPPIVGMHQSAIRDGFVQVEGEWRQKWVITEWTLEQISSHDLKLIEEKKIHLEALLASVQSHLDAKARAHGYDSILSATTYATSTNSHYKAEGQACVEWRDAVWGATFESIKSKPTIDELIAELPEIVWPVAP